MFNAQPNRPALLVPTGAVGWALNEARFARRSALDVAHQEMVLHGELLVLGFHHVANRDEAR